MYKIFVVVALLLVLTGCSLMSGFLAGVQDEIEGGRDNQPSLTDEPETKLGYILGSGVLLIGAMFLWGKKKK